MACSRIGVATVIKYSKFCEVWQEADEVFATAIVPFAYRVRRDVVAAYQGSGPHSCDMQLGAGESDVPHLHIDPRCQRSLQKSGNRLAAQRRFERVGEPRLDRALQACLALVPGPYVCVPLSERGVRDEKSARDVVRVEILGATFNNRRSYDRALASSVRPSDHIDARAGILNDGVWHARRRVFRSLQVLR